jgi:hypothetical protein
LSEPEIHDPGNVRKIEDLYVFMSIDSEGRHGIVASILPGLGSTPFVTGSPKAAETMKKLAEELAAKTGKPIGMFVFKSDGQVWQTGQN